MRLCLTWRQKLLLVLSQFGGAMLCLIAGIHLGETLEAHKEAALDGAIAVILAMLVLAPLHYWMLDKCWYRLAVATYVANMCATFVANGITLQYCHDGVYSYWLLFWLRMIGTIRSGVMWAYLFAYDRTRDEMDANVYS